MSCICSRGWVSSIFSISLFLKPELFNVFISFPPYVDAFIKEKVSVDKVVSSECKALIRFKKPQKDKIIQIIKDKFKEAEVIAQDDELAVVVDAPSECAINDSIKFIEDNNYCEDASKILKLS